MNKRVLLSGIALLVVACSIGIWRFSASGGDEVDADHGKVTAARPDMGRDTSAAHAPSSRGPRPEDIDRIIAPEQAEEEISRLLADDSVSKLRAARGLLAIAADARVDATLRVNALSHGLTLTSDDDYADLARADVEQNRYETPEMHRLLLDDAYDREDIAKLPAALALVKHAQGDLRGEAIELLAFVTKHDDEESREYERWRMIVAEHLSRLEAENE